MKSLARVRSRRHRCYELTFKAMLKEPGAEKFTLVHGYVHIDGQPVAHAWIETGDGMIYDTLLDRHIAWADYAAERDAVIERRYDRMEAVRMVRDTKNHGPWHTSAGIHRDDPLSRWR